MREAVGAAVCVVLGIVCAVQAIAGFNGFGTLRALGGVLAVAAVAGLGWAVVRRVGGLLARLPGATAGGQYVAVRAHSGSGRDVAKHEYGHWRLGKRLGHVISARIFNGGRDGGLVEVRLRSDDPIDAIAFLAAGYLNLGSKRGASGDRAEIDRLLKQFPPGERAAALRKAEGRARSNLPLFDLAGEQNRVIKTLVEKGSV